MNTVDYSDKIVKDLVQLARLSLTGKQQDVQLFIRRLAIRYRDKFPEFSHQLCELMRRGNGTDSILRGSVVEAIPVDLDSRLQLARPEYPVNLEVEPHWPTLIREQLRQLIDERKMAVQLMEEDLQPTRTALFTGPPGVGKTLAARWVARELNQPLIVLDLAAVMSSFLGRTGNNVRNVLDYAKGTTCVLLLDEFDALAKRRDDAVEIGELKRLVTVLLQEIDQWPASGLLLAATNHKELLDPAVWRRFEAVIDFRMPCEEDVLRTVRLYLRGCNDNKAWTSLLTKALQGLSYGEIEREIRRAQRQAVIKGQPLEIALRRIVEERVASFSKTERCDLALSLIDVGLSQREAHTLTGVSRDTIRKHQDGRSDHDARK